MADQDLELARARAKAKLKLRQQAETPDPEDQSLGQQVKDWITSAPQRFVDDVRPVADVTLRALNIPAGLMNEVITAPAVSLGANKNVINPWGWAKALAGYGRSAQEVFNDAGYTGDVPKYAGMALDMISPVGIEQAMLGTFGKVASKAAPMMGKAATETASVLSGLTEAQKAALKNDLPAFIEQVKTLKGRGAGSGAQPIGQELRAITTQAEQNLAKRGQNLANEAKSTLSPHEVEVDPAILDFIKSQDPDAESTKKLTQIFFGDDSAPGSSYLRQVEANRPLEKQVISGVHEQLPIQGQTRAVPGTPEQTIVSSPVRRAQEKQMSFFPEKSFDEGVIEGFRDQPGLMLPDNNIRVEKVPSTFTKVPATPGKAAETIPGLSEFEGVTSAIQDPLNLPMASPKLRLSGDKAVEARRALDEIAAFREAQARLGVKAGNGEAASLSRSVNDKLYNLPEVGQKAKYLNQESSALHRVQDELDKAGANPLAMARSEKGTELGEKLFELGLPEYQTAQQRFQGANKMVRDEEKQGLASMMDVVKTYAGKKPAFALAQLAEALQKNPTFLSDKLRKPTMILNRGAIARPMLQSGWDKLNQNEEQ